MGRRPMVNTTTEYCKQCEWHYGGDNAITTCDYLLKTGKRRKCPVGKCDKFKQKTEERSKDIPWSELSNLYQKKSCKKPIKEIKTSENM